MRMLPTVRDILDHDAVRKGKPEVVAGVPSLGRTVRWLHISELPDAASLIGGGELILTTGIGLPDAPGSLCSYIEALAEADAAGVVVELGRRFSEMPAPMVATAEARRLPLIACRRPIKFLRVTEAIHRLIVNVQFEHMERSQAIHAAFTELSVEGASTQRIVERAAHMAARPVVLENLARQVIAHAALGEDPEVLLASWEQQSRLVDRSDGGDARRRPGGDYEWITRAVAARGEGWGRLLLKSPTRSGLEEIVLERAAAAIALSRLLSERDRDSLEKEGHQSLLGDVVHRAYSSSAEIAVRAQALGVPVTDRTLVPAALVVSGGESLDDELRRPAEIRRHVDAVWRAARHAGVPALVGSIESSSLIGVLLSISSQDTEAPLEHFAKLLHRAFASGPTGEHAVLGVGSAVAAIAAVPQSFREAEHAAKAAVGEGSGKLYYRFSDLGLRGLLHLLRGDSRLHTFVDQQLGSLLGHDGEAGDDLLSTLEIYLDCGGNKSVTAEKLGISRPALYHRLNRLEHITGIGLDDVESSLSMHVALLALRVIHKQPLP